MQAGMAGADVPLISAFDAFEAATTLVEHAPLLAVSSTQVDSTGLAPVWTFGFLVEGQEVRLDIDGRGERVDARYDPAFYARHEVPINLLALSLDTASVADALDASYGPQAWTGKPWHLVQRHPGWTPVWEVGAINVDPPMYLVDPTLCTWTTNDSAPQAGRLFPDVAVLPATPVELELEMPCSGGGLQVSVSEGKPVPVSVALVGPYGPVEPTDAGWNWWFRTGRGTWNLSVTSDLPTTVTYATAQPEA